MLIHGGQLVIIDSVWNDELAKMGRSKSGTIKRSLSDGHEFEIYKRYFEKHDLYSLAEYKGLNMEIIYWGNVFFLAVSSFKST